MYFQILNTYFYHIYFKTLIYIYIYTHTYTYTFRAKNIGTLGKNYQRRLWKLICIVNLFDLLFKIHKNITFHWIIYILNGGEISLWYKIKISNTHWTQLLAPLEMSMSKISLKYITIHIHNLYHSRVIINMNVSSHGFLFHRNINRRENKAQIPLISSITMRKNKEYIPDVQQKIIALHKLVKWL